jgi:anti-repressor protein
VIRCALWIKRRQEAPPAGGALIQTFSFEGNDIRTVMIDSVMRWVGKDVCDRLGYERSSDAIMQHCRGAAIYRPIPDALGRLQETRVLTEADVFRLIVGSKLPDAERFRVWLFEQVLPSIRKTGSYTAPGAPMSLSCSLA